VEVLVTGGWTNMNLTRQVARDYYGMTIALRYKANEMKWNRVRNRIVKLHGHDELRLTST
jgi:hypothetical protein